MVVSALDIVAILDARLIGASEINRELVRRAVAEKRVRGTGLTPDCKALVVTKEGAVYTSGISAPTVAKRMTHLQQSAKAWDAET